jgi:hypothetical protein
MKIKLGKIYKIRATESWISMEVWHKAKAKWEIK